MALQLKRRETLAPLVLAQPNNPVSRATIHVARPAPQRAPIVPASVVRANTASNRSFLNKFFDYGPSIIKETVTDPLFYRDAAVGALRAIPHGAAQLSISGAEALHLPRKTQPNRVGRYLMGSEPIKSLQEQHKADVKKHGPLAAAGLGLFTAATDLPVFPKGVKPKVVAKGSRAAAKETAENFRNLAETERTSLPKQNIVRKAEDLVNPAAQLARNDRAMERALGRPLKASEKSEHLYDVTLSSDTMSRQAMINSGSTKVIKKYFKRIGGDRNFGAYYNARRILAEREVTKGKNWVYPISSEKLRNLVKEYETANPSAKADFEVLSKHFRARTKEATAAGVNKSELADLVMGLDQYYVPLQRVIPHELKRPSVQAEPTASLGRQTVIQKLTNNKRPLETDLRFLFKRDREIQNQINRAKAGQSIYYQAEKDIGKMRIHTSVEQLKAREALQKALKNLEHGSKTRAAVVAKTRAKARVASKAEAETRTAAIAATKKELANVVKHSGGDADSLAAIANMSSKELLDTAKWIANDPTAPVPVAISKWSRRSGAHQRALGQLDEVRQALAEAKDEAAGLRSALKTLEIDSTTGRQLISVPIEGYITKVEVPPGFAKVAQGLNAEEKSVLVHVFRELQRPFRMAWTGVLNPLFGLKAMLFYDSPMAVINSAEGGRVLVSPAGYGEMLKGFYNQTEFLKQIYRRGGQMVTGSRNPILGEVNPESFLKRAGGSYKQAIESLDAKMGFPGRAGRIRVAKAAFDKAKKRGLTDNEAWDEAVYAWNNVMPNYIRASSAARAVDSVVPYVSASIGGTRSYGQALRRRPVSTIAKTAAIPGVGAYLVWHNMASQEGQDFYNDTIESGREYTLDNNFILVMPGAKRDSQGNWTGVVKIPVPPELRALNRLVWKQTRDSVNGNGMTDPTEFARAAFDTATGQLVPSSMKNLPQRLSNPALTTLVAWTKGVDLEGSNPVVVEGSKDSETKQKLKFTLGQFGTAGQLIGGKSPVKIAISQVYGAKNMSDGAKYYQEYNNLIKAGNYNPDDKKAIETIHASDPRPGILDSVERATAYLNRPAVLEFDRKLDAWNRSKGKPGNPLFDLSADQLKRVLTYRQAKMLNAGKQTYDKNGNPLFLSLGLDEPWYDKFRSSESAFYSKLPKSDKPKAPTTFSGAVQPKIPANISKLQDQYFKLPSGTGAKTAFINAHPELLAWWDKTDGFTNKERKAIGLKVYDDQGNASYGSSGNMSDAAKYAQRSSSRRSGDGRSFGGRNSAGSAYKYAVSLSAGGGKVSGKVSVAKPKARAKTKTAAQRYVVKAKPKVTIKKSLV